MNISNLRSIVKYYQSGTCTGALGAVVGKVRKCANMGYETILGILNI